MLAKRLQERLRHYLFAHRRLPSPRHEEARDAFLTFYALKARAEPCLRRGAPDAELRR